MRFLALSNLLKAILSGFLRQRIGLDRAIAASSLTQMVRFITGPVTMMLMIRYFTPEEQGFFYSFAGVVGLQVFLEAGFAQSISQFTSREFATLRFNSKGFLVGSPAALSRLRSLFNQANRYYRVMATVLTLSLAIGGYWFFSSKPSYGIPWTIPWFVACCSSGIGFLITPFWAFLEGCNRMAQVATYRLWSTLGMFAVNAIGLSMGLGIYVVAWGAIFSLAFPISYLAFRWRRLLAQILRPPGNHHISWRKDVWGFQWRIAGTWMFRYFLESGIAPLAFQLSGPAAAGRIGMTFQIIRLIGGIANSWTTTKIPYWGALAAQNRSEELEQSWFAAARRNVSFTGISLISFVFALPFLGYFWPAAAHRFLNQSMVACFAAGWFFYSFWLVSMHYTRALRKEPYTFLHMAVGIAFIGTCFLFSRTLGDGAIPVAFALVHVPPAFIAVHLRRSVKASMAVQQATCAQ